MCDRRTDMYLSSINSKKKCLEVFLVIIFGTERRSEQQNENIIVSGTLKTSIFKTRI
jgi:hypothetical protein